MTLSGLLVPVRQFGTAKESYLLRDNCDLLPELWGYRLEVFVCLASKESGCG